GDIAVQEGDQWVGKLSSPESIEGLTQLQNLYENATKAPKDGEDAEAWVPFNEGDAAMFMAPGWARWSIEESLTDTVGALALPGVDGGAAPVFAGGSNIAVSAASPDQDLAMELMKLIFSDDYQKLLAENGLGPANSDFNSLMGDDQFAEAALAAAENAKLTPAAPNWSAVEQSRVMEEFFAKIAQGTDVATAAAEADAALESALNG
ncbi:MAG: extracellular solute-binding protein, partial [Cellulomonadaceae bacterium]